MRKIPENHGKPWSKEDIARLKKEVSQNTPTRVLGLHLGRTPASIYSKAQELRLSLKPVNQSPYGTR